jgi:hypothetical protein
MLLGDRGSAASIREMRARLPTGRDARGAPIRSAWAIDLKFAGGGNSANGKWNLVLDGNLLEQGDTGKLTVSQKSDMSVVYDARLTTLKAAADGSFTGAGEDAAKARFTITGTCDVTW